MFNGGKEMTQDNGPHLAFGGSASSYAPIWLKNLGLTIITLGFYRFWAKTRVRQYLWANTRLWGEPLEYTGTGLELFLGFLVALVVFVIPVTLLNVGIQIYMPTQAALGGALLLLFYVYLFIIANFAIYRAMRYRLTRTLWRGIRGGMATNGVSYGLKGAWAYVLAMLSLGFAAPWVAARLWNARWNDASHGNQSFAADASARPLYAAWIIAFVLAIALGGGLVWWMSTSGIINPEGAPPTGRDLITLVVGVFVFYLLLGVVFLIYQTIYWRTMIGATTWGAVSARMTAGPLSWLWLAVRSVLLILPLGLLAGWIPYITWKFWMKHLVIEGVPDAATLEQSTTAEPGRGEGLADALDMGAI